MLKFIGIVLQKAHSYGIIVGLALFFLLLALLIWGLRRYFALADYDRAKNSLHRTAIFIVLKHNSDDVATVEVESDADSESEQDMVTLLREIDTPAKLSALSDSRSGRRHEGGRTRLLSRVDPFAVRLLDAVEFMATTQFAEQVRLTCSVSHRNSNNSDEGAKRHPVAVFEIPHNVGRATALQFLKSALRDSELRCNGSSSSSSALNASSDSGSGGGRGDVVGAETPEQHALRILLETACRSSAVPSPATILHSNRDPSLIGTAKTNALFLRQREAYYANVIDACVGEETAVSNFAQHFAYGFDVGARRGVVKGLADFFLGPNRFAKKSLMGAHVVVSGGGAMSSVPDETTCRADLNSAGAVSFRDLSDDWVRGAGMSQAGSDANVFRRYDQAVILVVENPVKERNENNRGSGNGDNPTNSTRGDGTSRRGNYTAPAATTSSSSSTSSSSPLPSPSYFEIPACAALFHLSTRVKPRVVHLSLPHSVKYCLPEYATHTRPDSTVSSAARNRWHNENAAAIRTALTPIATDVAEAGFKLGERVLFRQFLLGRIADKITDFGVSVARQAQKLFGFGKKQQQQQQYSELREGNGNATNGTTSLRDEEKDIS